MSAAGTHRTARWSESVGVAAFSRSVVGWRSGASREMDIQGGLFLPFRARKSRIGRRVRARVSRVGGHVGATMVGGREEIRRK